MLKYPVMTCADITCRFFTFLLYLFLLHTLGISMFRFVAALCRNETVMAVVGSAFFLILILLGGFLLSAGDHKTPKRLHSLCYQGQEWHRAVLAQHHQGFILLKVSTC